MTEAPRDAIGLSERLRMHWLDSAGFLIRPPKHAVEAATALDALQARVKELESEQAAIVRDYQRMNSQLADEMKRATSAEQERDKLQGMLLLCGELGGIGKGETSVAYLRRLIDGLIDASRERDEAYERLKPFAEALEFATEFSEVQSRISVEDCVAARDLVRRLAAGAEKEGK